MRLVCYDLETNGFHGSILQFSFKGYDLINEKRIDFSDYVNPNEELNRYAAEIHGISSPNLAQMDSFEGKKNLITGVLRGAILVGFNNQVFDDIRLAKELGVSVHEMNQQLRFNLDVMRLCNQKGIAGSLEEIANRAGYQNPFPHNAKGDVETTLRLLFSLIKEELVELPQGIGLTESEMLTLIEKSVDMDDDAYLIIENESVQMYDSLIAADEIVQFGPYAGKSMAELRELDEHLWRQLGGTDD